MSRRDFYLLGNFISGREEIFFEAHDDRLARLHCRKPNRDRYITRAFAFLKFAGIVLFRRVERAGIVVGEFRFKPDGVRSQFERTQERKLLRA